MLQSIGSQRVGQDVATDQQQQQGMVKLWRRKWQPTPVLLPGTEEPGRIQSTGSQRVRHNLATKQ